MQIAFLSWEALHSVAVGGVAIHVSELAAALCRKGHQVHIFTRKGEGQRLYDDIFGVHYHRCPFEARQDFYDEMENMGQSFAHYFEEAEKKWGEFDLVHCHDWLPLKAALKIKRNTGVKLALTFHTTEWGRTGSWPESGTPQKIAELEKQGMEAAEAVICVSQEVRRQVDALYHCPDWKQGVVYYGVDLKPFDYEPFDAGEVKKKIGIDPMAPTVLFVGGLNFRKGCDLLIESAPAVLEKNPQVKFLIVGEGEMKEHLQNESARLGISGSVLFLGEKKGKEQIDLYRACDMVASPSRSDPFGIVTLNAWAASKPVAALKAGGPEEFMIDTTNGMLSEPQAEDLSEAINKMLCDFEHLRWMGRNGRVAAQTAFTWDKVAENTLEVYRRHKLVEKIAAKEKNVRT